MAQAHRQIFSSPHNLLDWISVIDSITAISLFFIMISIGIFWYFGRWTVRLIRQHQDIYPLLYALEEEEKKKQE